MSQAVKNLSIKRGHDSLKEPMKIVRPAIVSFFNTVELNRVSSSVTIVPPRCVGKSTGAQEPEDWDANSSSTTNFLYELEQIT